MARIHAYPASSFVIAKVLCGIGHTAFKRNLSLAGIGVNEVGFSTNDMYDDVVVDVLF